MMSGHNYLELNRALAARMLSACDCCMTCVGSILVEMNDLATDFVLDNSPQ